MIEITNDNIVIFSVLWIVLWIIVGVSLFLIGRCLYKKFQIKEHFDSFEKMLFNWLFTTVPGSFTWFTIGLLVFIKKTGWDTGFCLFIASFSLLMNCLNYIKNKD